MNENLKTKGVMVMTKDQIETHLLGIVGGTPLGTKVSVGQRRALTPAGRARVEQVRAAAGAAIPRVETVQTKEFLECGSGLFLFYNDATVVRWPQLSGPVANSLISIDETRPPDQDILLKSEEVAGFKGGAFTIDANGRLIIHPTGQGIIEVVVLGNPGGEWGSNTNC